ncbi:MAG TPA: hypothetical protein VFT12_10830, partial [Thermoanaerobaculia bacterium]|nr:hypothetical protein [Thermoanaerobaculia bacterium]
MLEFLLALVFAAAFAAILVGDLGWGRTIAGARWAIPLFAFSVLLIAIWAGGLWMRPFGPMAFGVPWLPFLVIGLSVVLLIATAAPPLRYRTSAPGAGPPMAAAAL